MIALESGLPTTESAFRTRVRLRAQLHAHWLRELWASESLEPGQGLSIGHAEVDDTLMDPIERERRAAAFREGPGAQALQGEIALADERFGTDPDWEGLRLAFGLQSAEIDLLALLVAAEDDPALLRVYGYLNDDVRACHVTIALAARLFDWQAGTRVDSLTALARWRLAWPIDGAGSGPSTTPWTVDQQIAAWLSRGPSPDPALGDAVEVLSRHEVAGSTCLYPDVLRDMVEHASSLRPAAAWPPRTLEMEIVGPSGSGRRTLVAQVAAGLGTDLVVADASRLFAPDIPLPTVIDQIVRVARLGRLAHAAVLWRAAETIPAAAWQATRPFRTGSLTFQAVSTPRGAWDDGNARRSFRLPTLDRAGRIALWLRLTDEPAPPHVTAWRLLPGEIVTLAATAAAGPDAVAEVGRQVLSTAPGDLFTPLPTPYTWEDLVLPATVAAHLREIESHVRLRGAVYEEWGYDALVPLGQGVAALFAGPSGTGKTMAAQVLAKSLDLELYRVDLAGVVNKYIGETEKRLKQVFDRCERANVLVLFDEADALFGRRMQVKDAHDRFANIEIDYLLQRMERFDGTVILASNRKSDLDPAFLRRLRFIVDFVEPGPVERRQLWQRALIATSPSGASLLDPIDLDAVATRLALTGADIKNAAIGAAFRARDEDRRITTTDVLAAVRRELAKRSVVLRDDWAMIDG